MKTVLVPVEAETSSAATLETAVLLGRHIGGYLEGFALGPDLPDVYGLEVPVVLPPILDLSHRKELASGARRQFEAAMQVREIPERFGEPTRLSYGWLKDDLQGDRFVGDYGRAFDIIVVGRPVAGQAAPRMSTLEEALFNSGRPVLVAPPVAPKALGSNVVIAWNGSTETARVVSFAMPLLLRAQKVTVLTAAGGMVPGPAGEQVARTLRINGVPAQALDAENEGRSVGETILKIAADMDADLLVKGAYTQSRLRQMIFGGPTRHLLDHATLPMIMAH